MVLHFSNLNFITSFALINENSTLLSQSVGKKKKQNKIGLHFNRKCFSNILMTSEEKVV